MKENTVISQLKQSLFDLTYILDNYKRREIMELLADRLQQILKTGTVEFAMYNRWQLQEKVISYSHQPLKYLKEIDVKDYMPYFEKTSDISVVEKNDLLLRHEHSEDNQLFKLKLHGEEKYYGLLLLSFKKGSIPSKLNIEKIRVEIEKFLKILYTSRHNKYIHRREHTLLQLSTKLHSVHRTSEILERIMSVLKLLFPNFEMSLLMSKEYEESSLPIKLIEYSSKPPLSGGSVAFISNEIQIEQYKETEETILYIPLSGAQGVYGVLQVDVPFLLQLDKEEFNFIERFSNMIGRAIERTTLYQSSTQQVSDLQTINYTTHELNLNLDQDEIISVIQKQISNYCYPEHFAAVLKRDKKDSLDIVDGSSKYFKTLSGKLFIEYIYNEVVQARRPLFYGDFHGKALAVPFKSIMAIPMESGSNDLGMITIVHTKPYFFSFDSFKLIQSIVQHASLALSNTILKERLKKTVITDYLTGLYSRNHLDSVIQKDMKTGRYGSFILFDIDDFKQINDQYGHYTGDQILITVAEIIKGFMKENFVGSRWGGEEFAVYLPNIKLEKAVELANQIRVEIADKTNPQVTVSGGVSQWEKEINDTIEALFIRTDEALYMAKEQDKNRVVYQKANESS